MDTRQPWTISYSFCFDVARLVVLDHWPFLFLKDKDTQGRPVLPAMQTRKGHRHGAFSYLEIPNVSIYTAARGGGKEGKDARDIVG